MAIEWRPSEGTERSYSPAAKAQSSSEQESHPKDGREGGSSVMTRTRRLKGRSVAGLLLVLLLAATTASANGRSRSGAEGAVGAAGTEAAAGAAAAYPAAARGPAAGPPASTARISLEFVDAELVDVFHALAVQSGVNNSPMGFGSNGRLLVYNGHAADQNMKVWVQLQG